ncbi:MAG: 16S rRNA processing protein RimM [Clostridia bacterium]|nr:16S rRNA processing protein RimM [Deltaproteobacteria bacterium]
MPGPSRANGDGLIRFGVLTRPHGVRGEVRLQPDDPEVAFPDVRDVRLSRRGEVRTLRIASLRAADDAYLIAFEGISDRDVVRDTLSGSEMMVPLESVATASENEAYVYELEGAKVVDEAGETVGIITSVLAGSAQDILNITAPDGSERLLPMIPQTIRKFDRGTKTLTIAPIPGLWE